MASVSSQQPGLVRGPCSDVTRSTVHVTSLPQVAEQDVYDVVAVNALVPTMVSA